MPPPFKEWFNIVLFYLISRKLPIETWRKEIGRPVPYALPREARQWGRGGLKISNISETGPHSADEQQPRVESKACPLLNQALR